MRRNKVVVGLAVVGLMFLAVGCAKPPQQELDGVKAGMSAAESAEAPKYAADAWDRAQQAMNAVNAEVEAQNAKFALFRSYSKAKELIAAANQSATEAKDAGVAGKEAAKNAAQAAMDAAKASLDAANALYTELGDCKRKPKGFSKDMEMMKGNLDSLAAQVTGIDSAFASEDYFGAKSQAESLKGQVDALAADMQSAKEKIKC